MVFIETLVIYEIISSSKLNDFFRIIIFLGNILKKRKRKVPATVALIINLAYSGFISCFGKLCCGLNRNFLSLNVNKKVIKSTLSEEDKAMLFFSSLEMLGLLIIDEV